MKLLKGHLNLTPKSVAGAVAAVVVALAAFDLLTPAKAGAISAAVGAVLALLDPKRAEPSEAGE